MKKITTLMVAGLAMTAAVQLTSCKKDKDKDGGSVVGTWQGASMHEKTYLSGVLFSDSTYSDAGTTVTFNEDKTYTYVSIDGTDTTNETGTYSTSGSTLIKTYTDAGSTQKDTANYSISGSTLTLSGSATGDFGGASIKVEFTETFNKK